MSRGPSEAELDAQVQGLPLTGYRHHHLRTLVLGVANAARAREFLGELLRRQRLDFGGRRTQMAPCVINIGFSYEGLRALGAPEAALAALREGSPAFAQGAALRAARYLGDAGENAPERWNAVFHRQAAHAWITMHADDPQLLDDTVTELMGLPGASDGVVGWNDPEQVPDARHLLEPEVEAKHLPDQGKRFVHFGLRDNITKPRIAWRYDRDPATSDPNAMEHRAGELLLGYPNDNETDLWTADGTPGHEVAEFLRNGSFGVLRQVQQYEDRLDDYLQAQLAALAAQGHPGFTKDYLKAKMCGRWANGARLEPHETTPPPDPDDERLRVDFGKDPYGWGCPFGSHIRRANPQKDPLLPPVQRTVFRRSVPYGRPYPGTRDDVDRGLVGVFFCARIDDQFELLVSEWLEKNPMGPPNAGRAKDPIAGHHDEPDAAFHIPLPGAGGIYINQLEPFIRTRGTLYALFPSRLALERLAAGSGA